VSVVVNPSSKALVRELKYFDAKELRAPCEEVILGSEIDLLIDDLLVTLRHHRGVGLSAPQIGVLKRVTVIEYDGDQLILINPRMIRHGRDRVTAKEGCLSLPGVFVEVERYRLCEVESLGKKYNVSNFLARIVQHEMDQSRRTSHHRS